MNINFDDFPDFKMPDELLAKLYDCTGYGSGTEGFIIAFVKQDGEPDVISFTASGTIHLALKKCLEIYLESEMNAFIIPPMIDMDGGEEDEL